MILVFGAAGTCGSAVTRELASAGARVRAFVRNEERAASARAAGASDVAVGDLRHGESVERALQGATGVFYVGPRFVADEAFLGRLVVRLAARAGVERFVYQSALHSSVTELHHHVFKREVEEALYESELEYTILQPARFMHNIVPGWKKILGTGIYAEPFSADMPIADVDYQDVAAAAAIALTRPGYGRASFELCCDGMLNRRQRVALLGEVLGRPVASGEISVEAWLQAAGITDPYERDARARMFNYYDRCGFRGGNALVLRSILGREPTGFRAFLERQACA